MVSGTVVQSSEACVSRQSPSEQGCAWLHSVVVVDSVVVVCSVVVAVVAAIVISTATEVVTAIVA